MVEAYRTTSSSIPWKPSPVVALATSVDESQVAAARADGSLEIWLVPPGVVSWHCQLTIHGDPKPESRALSLIWCRAGSNGLGCSRLLSSSINGCVSQWDLLNLKQKTVLDLNGLSIWQMAVAPRSNDAESKPHANGNGFLKATSTEEDDSESRDSEYDSDSDEINDQSVVENLLVALACDDGCVRIYTITDIDEFVYTRSLPRVSGRVLSVTWSPDAKFLYSGSSDGIIRSWDAKLGHEIYRITVGLGGLGSGAEICVWSLISLRCGNLVSADSTGSVQFWDSQHGTLLQAHSYHKGPVNALAASPSHNMVFSAGSDGQVIPYKLSSSDDKSSSDAMKKWIYVAPVKAHTHDVWALTVAVPISKQDPFPGEALKRGHHKRRKEKPDRLSYHKWAHLGAPMLISAGNDTKLFAYPVEEFTSFSPHDICRAPQRLPFQLVHNTAINQTSMLLVQASSWLDILRVRGPSNGLALTDHLARVESPRKIICSTMSNTGVLFAYSDDAKPSLFELKSKVGKSSLTLKKRQLPRKLPFAHSMVFSFDSSSLMIAGDDRRIHVVDVSRAELVHTFTPCRDLCDQELPPSEPPITKMFTSSNGQWLAAINCFGDVYIFNLEMRQHWFISRLDNASVTAGAFSPQNNNVLVITTSSNQVYVLDVEERQLGDWLRPHAYVLPNRFEEFPGEVIGLSFPPSSSSSVIVYSAWARCSIEFGSPVDRDGESDMPGSGYPALKKLQGNSINRELKRKLRVCQPKDFEVVPFKNPTLFVGHLSESSILIIDKPWMEVLKSLDYKPLHRHIYGS